MPRLYSLKWNLDCLKMEQTAEKGIEDILEAGLLKADYIVTHMGSHKETSEAAGIKRFIDALNIIIDKTLDYRSQPSRCRRFVQ